MDNLMYVPIAPGIRIEVPVSLTKEEINQRVEKYRESLERNREQSYNPKKNHFTKTKI